MLFPSMHYVWQAFLGCFWAEIQRGWPHYTECGIGLCNPPPSMEQSQAWSLPFSSSFFCLQVHALWPTQRRSGFPLCLKREEEKCPRVCRDDLQFSPAEADRMRLWAVPLPSMLLLFKMKRRLRKGRTTRTEMCLAVSARTLCSWPGSPRPFTLVAVSNLTDSCLPPLGQSGGETWVKSLQVFYFFLLSVYIIMCT